MRVDDELRRIPILMMSIANGRNIDLGGVVGFLSKLPAPEPVLTELRQQLRRLKASGLTIVLAEQNVRFVSDLGDRVYILEKGMVRYDGPMTRFLADAEVRQTYLAV